MLHAGAHGRPDSALDHARHAARKAWTAHDYAQCLCDGSLARRPRTFALQRLRTIGTGHHPFFAKRRGEISRVRAIAGQDWQGDQRRARHHGAGYRPPLDRRYVEHVEDWPRHSQAGKERYVPLAALGPMAVADLASEYFETELLRAVIAARGVFGTFLGPWSAGSALVLLIRAAGDPHPAGSASFAAGGMGAVTQAMASAAKAAGAEIRSGVEVIEIRVKDGSATGVLLSTGEEIAAKVVVSNADPKRTLLQLIDSTHLSPDFVQKLQHYRGNGTVAKVNLALSGLPNFTAIKNGSSNALKGPIHIGHEIDYLERAFDESKY